MERQRSPSTAMSDLDVPLHNDNNLNFIDHIFLRRLSDSLANSQLSTDCDDTNGPSSSFSTSPRPVEQFLDNLIDFYEASTDSVIRWRVHLIAKHVRHILVSADSVQLTSDAWTALNRIAEPTYSELLLVIENNNILGYEDIEQFYEHLHEFANKDESLVLATKLKNSFFADSTRTAFVIDAFSRKYNALLGFDTSFVNAFSKIYFQSLIHALKNANQPLILEILLRSSAAILHDHKLNTQIIEHLISNSAYATPAEVYLDLYTKFLFTRSTQLVELLDDYKTNHDPEPLFSVEPAFAFNWRRCFLFAVKQKRHFLSEFCHAFFLARSPCEGAPVKFRILANLLFLQNALQQNSSSFASELFQFEIDLLRLFLVYESEIQATDDEEHEDDAAFVQLIEKFRFVFRFANWTNQNLNVNKNEKSFFCYNVIASLLNGNSPLKILAGFSYFELRFHQINHEFYKENIVCNDLSALIDTYDAREAVTFRAFLVLRLVLFTFFAHSDQDVFVDVDQIRKLLESIEPIQFRVEILENIFLLLFLSRKDLNLVSSKNNSSEGEDPDRTLTSPHRTGDTSESGQQAKVRRSRNRPSESSVSQKSCVFLCPNWLIPQLLGVLKEVLFKTSSELYDAGAGIDAAQFETNKLRLNQLVKYVADGQFRNDVIRPTFYKTVHHHHTTRDTPAGINGMPAFSPSSCHSVDESSAVESEVMRAGMETVSATSSDVDNRHRMDWKTSLISCMLASQSQLLCYTLVENSIENARKIVQLFEDDLRDTMEYNELKLLEHQAELGEKISEIHLSTLITGNRIRTESTVTMIGNEMSTELTSSLIQSLIFETILKIGAVDSLTKKMFIIDYALSLSPSMEVTQAMLDSIYANNVGLSLDTPPEAKPFTDKLDRFVGKLQKLINNLGAKLHIGQLSFGEFVNKNIQYSSTLDANSVHENIVYETAMFRLYMEYQELTHRLENRIVDDPSSLTNDEGSETFRRDADQLLGVFKQIAEKCRGGQNFYLQTLLLYVCKVSKALGECKRRNFEVARGSPQAEFSSLFHSTWHFSILRQSPSAILCSMVIKSKISPKIIDDLAMNMKVNLMAVLCSVYCPSIATSDLRDHTQRFSISELVHPCLYEIVDLYQRGIEHCDNRSITSTFVANFFAEEVDESFEKFTEQSFQPLINSEVLNYFNGKCPILVELLQITALISDAQLNELSHGPGTKLHFYDKCPLLRWIDLIRKNFFFGDMTATVSLALYPRILSTNAVVLKSLEHFAVCQNYMQIYNVFKFVNVMAAHAPSIENMTSSWDTIGKPFEMLQNAVFCRLAIMQENARFIFCIIHEPKVKCELVQHLVLTSDRYNETFRATRLVRLALQSILDDRAEMAIDVSEYKIRLEKLLAQIEFFSAVGQLTGLKSWKLAQENLDGVNILTIIKTKKRFTLAVDWYRINGLEKMCFDLHIELLIHAFSELNDYSSLKKLFHVILEQVQLNDVIVIVEKTLSLVENFELQSFLVDLLIGFHRKRMNFALVEAYEQHKLGIEMLKLISVKVRDDYVKLISQPTLLLEQLLMNCEIDSLQRIGVQLKTLPMDALVEKYAQKAVQIEIYDGSSVSGSDLTSMSNLHNDSISARMPAMFMVPERIPSRDQWVSDTAESHCMICHVVRFNMFNRRHHCRRCGRVLCQGCSANSFLISEVNPNVPVRVCNDCFAYLKLTDRKESTAGLSMCSANSGGSFTVITPDNAQHRRTSWFLYPNEESINESRRAEFAYECSPSVTLCLAILRLHSNKRRCCKFIIDKICAPLLENTDSRNVDPTLLIEMIRSLLMSTRISVEAELNGDHLSGSTRSDLRQNDIEQLNLYLDRLDVIRMLINCNYGTKQMIGFVLSNNVQKLQERLIEIERFELAIDIAKKYGIDSSSIWKTWAMVSLKHSQFPEARRKFSRFFDQSTRTSDVQSTLKSIVDILRQADAESGATVGSIKDKCEQILLGKFDFTASSPEISTSSHFSRVILDEILHYLKSYGTNEELLRFYVKFSFWKEAAEVFVAHWQHQDCSNAFLTELFLPAQRCGAISSLFTAIRGADPQLAILWSSLIFVCKYLDKGRFYNCLYRVQLFMSDYLRAAITQINHFFLASGTEFNVAELGNYDELASRLGHLEKARDNCNMFLHNIELIRLKQGCLHVDRKDVLKQIRLIEIQIDVLKRFRLKKVSFPVVGVTRSLSSYFVRYFDCTLFKSAESANTTMPAMSGLTSSSNDTKLAGTGHRRSLTSSSSSSTSLSSTSQHPPTLLEHNPSRKCYIAALIILNYDDSIEESFRFSLRIIQEHQLDADVIYKIVAGLLISNAIEKQLSNIPIMNWIDQFLHCVRQSQTNDDRLGRRSDTLDEFKMNAILTRLRTNSGSSSSAGSSVQQTANAAAAISDEIVTSTLNIIKWTLDTTAGESGHAVLTNSERSQLAELTDLLVKLLSDDHTKIDTYLAARKLKLAYLLAVSSPKVDARASVELVAQKARQLNDHTYIKICDLWLMKNASLHS